MCGAEKRESIAVEVFGVSRVSSLSLSLIITQFIFNV